MPIILVILFVLAYFSGYAQQPFISPSNSVYQYSVPVGDRQAFLWVPPNCKDVRGVIISLSNLLERKWLEDPLIRKTATEEGLGIIWVGPGKASPLTADMKPGAGEALQKMLKDLASESGYSEIEYAPILPMGHSANGHFAWTVANWNPDRVIAAIPVKTVPFPASFNFENVPVCYVVGETTEWPQYRVPDPATKPGDRDFFWPVVRQSAVALRTANENNLVAVVTDPGGGHFDWNERQAKFIALYIKKACHYRLPKQAAKDTFVQLNKIKKESGWLTDTGGMEPDTFPRAPYKQYKGDPKKAYWFFDEETAKAAVQFNGDRKKRQKQMLTFVQDGQLLPVAKQGFAPLKYMPEEDGLTFTVEGAFLPEVPKELIGRGTKLGHAKGPISFRVITGPAVQIGPTTFRIQFDRTGLGGDIWLQEEHPGNSEYRHAVQPGLMKIPAKLTRGKSQVITFPGIRDRKAGTKAIPLSARSDSGLPVQYYIVAGPAVVEGDVLRLTKIPVKSKFPVKVTVVAYQWGRTFAPLYQTAEMVERTFYIIR
ncbi:MAG TPA: hypothetical protein VFT06_04010 [Flavisolibacter sp.]|nr:hypothetical protein [Flavisolibacter sp.]